MLVADADRRIIARETRGANALLDRLMGSPKVQRDVEDARTMLQIVQPELGAGYGSVALAPGSAPIAPPVGLRPSPTRPTMTGRSAQ
jgi:hypothetical protein